LGPNEGKTFLEQIKCIARALTAYTPYLFDLPVVEAEKLALCLQGKNKSSHYGKWVKTVNPKGTHYINQYSLWSGKHKETLPPGEKCEITIHCTEKEANRTLEFFKETVRKMVRGKNISIPDESIVAATDEREIEIDRETIDSLKGTLKAINPDFNKNKIIEFRNWLEQLTQTQEVIRINLKKYPAGVNHFLAVQPKHLKAFSRHLATERAKNCVDAKLMGSIGTTVDVCRFVAEKDDKVNHFLGATKEITFSLMAIYLTSSERVDPEKILAATISRAINSGYGKSLLELVDIYQDSIYRKISDALNAKTTDEMLDFLYQAIPLAYGARAICYILQTAPVNKVDSKTQKISTKKFGLLDENITRCLVSFTHQIHDFKGQEWRAKKQIISKYLKMGNDEYAKKHIKFWIDQQLLYPKSVINDLLTED
jgi:hypothetical protein